MKRALIALTVLALAVPAFAGVNPNVRMFVTTDPTGYVHSAPDAVAGSVVPVYVCLDCLGDYGEGGGITGVSLALDFQCSGFANSVDITGFHPSAQTVLGGPDDLANGWVIAAPECVEPGPEGIICVALVNWFYFEIGAPTVPGDVVILPSPFDGAAVVDCNNDLDFFCVLSHGAIGQEVVTPGDEDCDCEEQSPVEDSTWGAIKALYR